MRPQWLQQPEVVFVEVDETFGAHFTELVGEGTAVEVEIVGQLLAVEGDVEFRTSFLAGLGLEVGEDPAADVFGGGVEAAIGQLQILTPGYKEQVGDKGWIPCGFLNSGGLHLAQTQKKNSAVAAGNDIYHQRFVLEQGIGFCKDLVGTDMGEDVAVSLVIDALDADAAI